MEDGGESIFSGASSVDRSANREVFSFEEDFVVVGEFSEREGPIPLMVLPPDGGGGFDTSGFVVRTLAADYQRSSDPCSPPADSQVVFTIPSEDATAYVHHFTLYDIHARGYVRPVCMSYVTRDHGKIMAHFDGLLSAFSSVSSLLKTGNQLVFLRDLEHRLKDLKLTKESVLAALENNEPLGELSDAAKADFTPDNVNAFLVAMEDMYDRLKESIYARVRDDPKLASFAPFVESYERESASGSYVPRLSSTLHKVANFSESGLRSLSEICLSGFATGVGLLRKIQRKFSAPSLELLLDSEEKQYLAPREAGLVIGGSLVINFAHAIQEYGDDLVGPLNPVSRPRSDSNDSLASDESHRSICLSDSDDDSRLFPVHHYGGKHGGNGSGGHGSGDGGGGGHGGSGGGGGGGGGRGLKGGNGTGRGGRGGSVTASSSKMKGRRARRRTGDFSDATSFEDAQSSFGGTGGLDGSESLVSGNGGLRRGGGSGSLAGTFGESLAISNSSLGMLSSPGSGSSSSFRTAGRMDDGVGSSLVYENVSPGGGLDLSSPGLGSTRSAGGETASPSSSSPYLTPETFYGRLWGQSEQRLAWQTHFQAQVALGDSGMMSGGGSGDMSPIHPSGLGLVPGDELHFNSRGGSVHSGGGGGGGSGVATPGGGAEALSLYAPNLERMDVLRFQERFSFAEHIVYALLSGRPVVVYARSSSKALVKTLVSSLSLFVPGLERSVQLWRNNQMTLADLASLKLVGLCKAVPISKMVQTHATVFYYEEEEMSGPRYSGGEYVHRLLSRKKDWPSHDAFIAHVTTTYSEIGMDACIFYFLCCVGLDPAFVEAEANLGYIPPDLRASLEKLLDSVLRGPSLREPQRSILTQLGVTGSDIDILRHLVRTVLVSQTTALRASGVYADEDVRVVPAGSVLLGGGVVERVGNV